MVFYFDIYIYIFSPAIWKTLFARYPFYKFDDIIKRGTLNDKTMERTLRRQEFEIS